MRVVPSTTRRALSRLGLAVSVLVCAPGGARAETSPGAAALESRLYAPCCYNGTLDIHGSELARELREEIEVRLARGEASDAIQADFVARYGSRVVAARSDEPLRAMGLWLLALVAVSGVGVGAVLFRWVRRPKADAPAATPPRDALDDRVDADLADLR